MPHDTDPINPVLTRAGWLPYLVNLVGGYDTLVHERVQVLVTPDYSVRDDGTVILRTNKRVMVWN